MTRLSAYDKELSMKKGVMPICALLQYAHCNNPSTAQNVKICSMILLYMNTSYQLVLKNQHNIAYIFV